MGSLLYWRVGGKVGVENIGVDMRQVSLVGSILEWRGGWWGRWGTHSIGGEDGKEGGDKLEGKGG